MTETYAVVKVPTTPAIDQGSIVKILTDGIEPGIPIALPNTPGTSKYKYIGAAATAPTRAIMAAVRKWMNVTTTASDFGAVS